LLSSLELSLSPALSKASASLSAKEKRSSSFLYSGFFNLVLLLCVCFGLNLGSRLSPNVIGIDAVQPHGAVAALEKELNSDSDSPKVFHSPDWGGYLSFLLWPQLKTYVDDRNVLNGREYYERFFTLSLGKPGWSQLLQQENFDFALLRPQMPLNVLLSARKDWEQIYQDEDAVLYKKISGEAATDPSR
ncbi:MAG: hypothetical protein KDD66_17875, partial [Bdellovibrionales bacterium]|nr:hypothetical protein [Bdellovibrionales bacterium]